MISIVGVFRVPLGFAYDFIKLLLIRLHLADSSSATIDTAVIFVFFPR